MVQWESHVLDWLSRSKYLSGDHDCDEEKYRLRKREVKSYLVPNVNFTQLSSKLDR